jgi:predicted permease
VFVAAVMFPATVILLESEGRGDDGRARPVALMKQIVLNPMVLSTLMGLVWQSRACRCRRRSKRI